MKVPGVVEPTDNEIFFVLISHTDQKQPNNLFLPFREIAASSAHHYNNHELKATQASVISFARKVKWLFFNR